MVSHSLYFLNPAAEGWIRDCIAYQSHAGKKRSTNAQGFSAAAGKLSLSARHVSGVGVTSRRWLRPQANMPLGTFFQGPFFLMTPGSRAGCPASLHSHSDQDT